VTQTAISDAGGFEAAAGVGRAEVCPVAEKTEVAAPRAPNPAADDLRKARRELEPCVSFMRFLVVASFHRLNVSTARLTEAGMAFEGGIYFISQMVRLAADHLISPQAQLRSLKRVV
jgi:hypothetical protein